MFNSICTFGGIDKCMVRRFNRPFLNPLTMYSGKEEPHMVRAVAE